MPVVVQDDLMDAAEVKDMLDVAGHVKVSRGGCTHTLYQAAGMRWCQLQATRRQVSCNLPDQGILTWPMPQQTHGLCW